MNDYDSNRIVDLLGEAMQLEKTEDLNEADVVVLSTFLLNPRKGSGEGFLRFRPHSRG